MISKGKVVRCHVGHAAVEVVVGAVGAMAKLGVGERHLRREVLRRVQNARGRVRRRSLLEQGLQTNGVQGNVECLDMAPLARDDKHRPESRIRAI